MQIKSYDELVKYIEDFEKNPEKIEDLSKNIMTYIRLCNDQNILTLIDKVSVSNQILNRLRYNLATIYQEFGIKPLIKITKGLDFQQRYGEIYTSCARYNPAGYSIDKFVEDLLDAGEKDYLEKNIKGVISSESMKILLEKGMIKKLKLLYPEKIESILPNIVSQMANIPIEIINRDLIEALVEIVKQVIYDEKTDISELEYVDRGSTSIVYKLGNKVIKFGTPRNTDKIPYHRRILQPLMRRNLDFGEKNNVYVEVAEYIERCPNITDDDIYNIYKELRNAGIVWLDCKKANVGRLVKDNSIHFSEPIYARNETVGYISDTIKKDVPMPEGELVILDTDLLVKEEELKNLKLSHTIDMRFFYNCEKRYQEEKKNNLDDREER